jgi:uncharacterized cupredoxin-like copper-binding protein
MSDARFLGTAVVVAVGLVVAGGYGIVAAGDERGGGGGGGGGDVEVLGPGHVTVRLDIEHSLFDTTEIRVREGSHVTFVVDNGDPIGHELIVGDEEVHARHESGTHASHPAVDGEVSVEPNAQAETTYAFDEPGEVEFACHLPRHYDYGMHGTIVVVPAESAASAESADAAD